MSSRSDHKSVNTLMAGGAIALVFIALALSAVFNFVLDSNPLSKADESKPLTLTLYYQSRKARPSWIDVTVNYETRLKVDQAGRKGVTMRCYAVDGTALGSAPVDWPGPGNRHVDLRFKLPVQRMQVADRCELLDARGRRQATASVY